MIPKRLLIVDDEELFTNSLAPYFELKGMKVFTAASGEKAMEIFQKESPELILLDIHLEGQMSGFDVLKEVRKLSLETKIIIITGFDGGPQKEAQDLGVSYYLNKPVTIKVLEDAINNALSQG